MAGNPTGAECRWHGVSERGRLSRCAKAAGVDVEHVIDYAGIQSGRLPEIAKDLGSAAGEAGGRMIDALRRALAKTAAKAAV